MELWIRSQNRECLMKVDKLDLDNDKTGIFCYSYDDMDLMGKYKSKERALMILDEIQNILQPRLIVHEPEINYDDMIHLLSESVVIKENQKIETELKQAGQVVYQMPEE